MEMHRVIWAERNCKNLCDGLKQACVMTKELGAVSTPFVHLMQQVDRVS